MAARPRRAGTADARWQSIDESANRDADAQRSSVAVWRPGGARSRRYSVRVVAGTTADEMAELVRTALAAAEAIEAGPGVGDAT
jgi:hypothetical protein